ncbi:unnamed protein product [Strongylus vulgaris]|uniref:F-box domain-containing protein n=1 Tax=Strongylus vulgaris TaxID=40348 RepID=A0A3P7I2J1_STRVU|nr:unnamed protein product [Strongylus vulgaris]
MTYDSSDAVMSSLDPPEGVVKLSRSPRRTAFSEVEFLRYSVLTPDSNQHMSETAAKDDGFTLLKERKRHRNSSEAMDMDESGINKIRMKPDILTFYRTPGAFKFCRRVSSGPFIDFFHASNRGSPLPDNVVIEILSYLNKRDLCNAMATCKLLYSAG